MKIAVISDIHSNLDALNAVIEDAKKTADGYFCLGDIVGYGAEPNETIETLININFLSGIAGNHDLASLDGNFTKFKTPHGHKAIKWTHETLSEPARSFLKNSLAGPGYFSNYGFFAYHGGPKDHIWQYIFPSTPLCETGLDVIGKRGDIIFIGHSHLQFFFSTPCGKTIINPGSVGQSRNGTARAHYVIFDSETKGFEFKSAAYDVKSAAAKIIEAGLDQFLAQRLYLGI